MSLITKIKIAGSVNTRKVEILPCSFSDVVAWQRQIQDPYIAPGGGIGHDWDWPAYHLGCHFSEQVMGRKAISFQLRVEGPGGSAVPVAQAIFSLPYYYPGDLRKRCVFVWLIAGTPLSALQAFGVHERYSLMGPLLDTAIQVSLAHGLGGRIGLHAATGASPIESEKLVQKYLDQGLEQRTKSGVYFRRPFRKDDGKFFYLNETKAEQFALTQDILR